MSQQISTVQQFAEACKQLTCVEIYELFEFELSQDMRDTIYTQYESESCEPCRAAMIAIGNKFNVQSLQDF